MKKGTSTRWILWKIRLQKAWFRVLSTPVGKRAHRTWHKTPVWGRHAAIVGIVVVSAGLVVWGALPSQAAPKTLSLGSTDIRSGTTDYGGINISADGSSMRLQDGSAGSWDTSAVNGMQTSPTMTYAQIRFAYGPNNTLYMLSSFDGNCYLNRFDIEQQAWVRLSTPPIFCGAGSILEFDGTNGLYYAPGGPSAAPSNRFFRYD